MENEKNLCFVEFFSITDILNNIEIFFITSRTIFSYCFQIILWVIKYCKKFVYIEVELNWSLVYLSSSNIINKFVAIAHSPRVMPCETGKTQ